jgi:hypothetical protein
MILRRAHIAALERAAHDIFIDRLVEHTRGPRMLVEVAVMFAEDAGLETESDICAYVADRLAKDDL